MKKIKLTLLALVGLSASVFGQANISIEAPPLDEQNASWAAPSVPNGTSSAAYHRGCFYITQAELSRLALTNSVITSFGFDYYRGANVATNGQFTLYLQNTNDLTYNKGLSFSTAIVGMSTTYTGNLTVPGNGGAATPTAAASVNLTTPFTYTGGGLYVAWDWYGAAANATVFARAMANVALTTGGGYASASSAGPAPDPLTTYQFRPVMRFTAANTATNDLSVIRVTNPGMMSKMIGVGHVITAQIKNNSVNAVTNVPVSLNITGPNAFTNTKTIPTIGAGGLVTVSFDPYNPTANGMSTISVNVPSDQYTANDLSWVQTQSVNCTDYSNSPPYLASEFNDGSYGYGGAAAIVTRITPPADATLTAIKFVVGAGASAVGMRGVLLDAGGTMIAATRSLNVNGPAAAGGQVFTTFRFDTAQALTSGTTYYFGMEQLNGGFPFATRDVANYRIFANQYFNAPAGGGAIGGVQNQMGEVGIQAVLNFSNTFITASPSSPIVCNNRGIPVGEREIVTITAAGANGITYQWSGTGTTVPVSYTASSIVLTPSINPLQGTYNFSVTATHPASGCKSNQAVVTLTLANCTGIPDNSGFGNNIVVYPNPVVNGKAIVKGLEGTNYVTVYNVLGQVVQSSKTEASEVEVDLQNQAAGSYMVKVTGATGQSKVIKINKAN